MPIGPSSQLEGDGACGEVDDIHSRRGYLRHIRKADSSSLQQFGHAFDISASSHAHGDFDRALSIGKRPIDYLTRDE